MQLLVYLSRSDSKGCAFRDRRRVAEGAIPFADLGHFYREEDAQEKEGGAPPGKGEGFLACGSLRGCWMSCVQILGYMDSWFGG